MNDLTLITGGKAYLHREAISKLRGVKLDMRERSKIIKELLPKYEIQDKPRLFHDSVKPDKYFIGGYGCGKTYTGGAECIFLMYVNRPYAGLAVIQTKSASEATTEDDLVKLCKENNLEYWTEDDRGGTYRYFYIRFGEGEENIGAVMLASGSNPKLLKGTTVPFAWIDEPFVQPKETMEVVIGRARDMRAVINEVFYTGTIEPATMEWGEEIVDDDFKGDENTFKCTVSTEENKFAPKVFIDRMKRTYSIEMQEIYIKGKNLELAGERVYTGVTDNNLIPVRAQRHEGIIRIGLGFDFNVGKMCCAEFNFRKRLRIQVDEHMTFGSNTEELIRLVINRLIVKYPGIDDDNKKHKYSVIIGMDASARARQASAKRGVTSYTTIRDELKKAGITASIRILKENPPVFDRVDYINKIAQEGFFLICRNCAEAVKDRKFTKWKKDDEGKFKINKKNGRSHMSEAADYLLWITKFMPGMNEDAEQTGIIMIPREDRYS